MKMKSLLSKAAAAVAVSLLLTIGAGAQEIQGQVVDGQPVAPEKPGVASDKERANRFGSPKKDEEVEKDPEIEALLQFLDEAEEQENGAKTKLQGLMDKLRESLPQSNGSWSVYVCNLTDGVSDSIGSHKMQAASLIKLYIMGAIYERYDEMVAYAGQDTLDNYLYNMITVSDNDCANNLVSCLGHGDTAAGMSVVNTFCMEHDFIDTSMGRLLLQSNEFGDNYTSVEDTGDFMRRVYRGVMGIGTTDLSHTDQMFSLLSQQQRRHKIPSQMPAGVSVASKTGELDTVENDAGIIFNTALGNDLVIVFMSEQLQDCGSAQATIGSLSRMIYDYYNS